MKLVVVGAREDGLAHIVLDYLAAAGDHEVVGFLDEAPELEGTTAFGLPIWGPPCEVQQALDAGAEGTFLAMGDCAARARIAPQLEAAGLEFVNILGPGAYVAPSARLGRGVIVGANAIVSSGVVIGELSIVFALTVVGHHSRVGAAVLLAGGSMLAGRASVGDRTLVGLGARVMPDVTVGKEVVVGAGAVVTRDVPDGARVAGIPARTVGE